MQSKETIIKQAEAMGINPFQFLYRRLELKDQECELLKEALEIAENKIKKFIYDESKGESY